MTHWRIERVTWFPLWNESSTGSEGQRLKDGWRVANLNLFRALKPFQLHNFDPPTLKQFESFAQGEGPARPSIPRSGSGKICWKSCASSIQRASPGPAGQRSHQSLFASPGRLFTADTLLFRPQNAKNTP